MKFTADSAQGNVIRSYQPGELRVGDHTIRDHIIISQDRIIHGWSPAPLSQLSVADFAPALELSPDIILLGTGRTQQFPSISVLTELMQGGTAIEVMETSAACRTFNVLIGERRSVVAALLIE